MTTEIGRIFCPSCGNGGTLRKVAVTVGENGMVVAARRPRISLRGTKVSIYIYIYQDFISLLRISRGNFTAFQLPWLFCGTQ